MRITENEFKETSPPFQKTMPEKVEEIKRQSTVKLSINCGQRPSSNLSGYTLESPRLY
jgi:hypothetical protein